MDVLFAGITLLFLALSLWLVVALERLLRT